MSVSSLSSTGGSGAPSSSDPTLATSSSNLFSQTFTTPPPASSSGGGGGGGSLNEGSASNSGTTPASLYLYTFLATLLLLLSVSCAIVFRSILLRRRRTRLIEEAIQTGLIPLSLRGPGGFPERGRSGRKRIDPKMKPKLWEAVMENTVEKMQPESNWEWDLIKPFAVTAVEAPGSKRSQPVEAVSVTPETQPAAPRSSRRAVAHRIFQFFDPASSLPLSPLPDPSISNENNDNASTLDVNEAGLRSGPHNVRVAVLIAMPSQSTSRPSPQRNMPVLTPILEHSQRSSLEVASGLPALDLPQPQAHPTEEGKDAEELPYIEFGIADLGVRQDHEPDSVDRREDNKRPISTMSSVDVV